MCAPAPASHSSQAVLTPRRLVLRVRHSWRSDLRARASCWQKPGVKPCDDFNWCADVQLENLKVGDNVEARYKHGEVRLAAFRFRICVGLGFRPKPIA